MHDLFDFCIKWHKYDPPQSIKYPPIKTCFTNIHPRQFIIPPSQIINIRWTSDPLFTKPFLRLERREYWIVILIWSQHAQLGDISLEDAELYMNSSDKARRLTQEYFDIPVHLHFAFTHLVCRYALESGRTFYSLINLNLRENVLRPRLNKIKLPWTRKWLNVNDDKFLKKCAC